MYRALIMNNAPYVALAILLIAVAIKLLELSKIDADDKASLFFNSFFFHSKPVLRNMISKQKQEFFRFNNGVNKVIYAALLGVLVLRLVMGLIA